MRIGPHEWVGNGYHCEACHASYHCAACSDGSGGQGHSMQDGEGFFFSCQETERAQRWRESFIADRRSKPENVEEPADHRSSVLRRADVEIAKAWPTPENVEEPT